MPGTKEWHQPKLQLLEASATAGDGPADLRVVSDDGTSDDPVIVDSEVHGADTHS